MNYWTNEFPKDFKKLLFFHWTKQKTKQTIKTWQCFTNWMIFWKLNWTTEQTISFNKQFSWTIDLNEKMNEIDEKWTILLRTNEIIFFNDWKNEKMSHLKTMNVKNKIKSQTCPSLLIWKHMEE